VLRVESSQDKIRMAHFVPLHPQVVKAIQTALEGRKDDECAFRYNSFQTWIKRQKIPRSRFKGHFVLADLRKFAEQHGDIIQSEQSNRAYVLTHGVSGVDWRYYKHPLPDTVYDVYMKYWAEVSFEFQCGGLVLHPDFSSARATRCVRAAFSTDNRLGQSLVSV